MLKKRISTFLISCIMAIFAYPNANALDLNISSDYFNNNSNQKDTPLYWNAINLGGQSMITNTDVKKFIEVVYLSDSMLVQMFKEVKGDYAEYKIKKDKWLLSHFTAGLKQLAYIQMVQKYATRSAFKKEWNAFKTTESEYFKQIEDMENEVLKKLLDEGKGIVYARKKFGEQLIKVGYPHNKNNDKDGEALYWNWYKLQKKRIKENLRIKELKKFEYLTALGYEKEFYVRPVELFDFAKKVTATIEDKIQGKRISQAQVGKLISEDPGLQVMLKGITFYGPETTKLSVLKGKAPQVYNDFLKNIDSNVISFIRDRFAAKIRHYEDVARKMANKYKTTAKLDELSQNMKKQFITSNDYGRLMMSKIYDLASVGIKNGTYAPRNKQRKAEQTAMISKYLKALSSHANDFLSNTNAMLKAKNDGVRLEDNFSVMINRDYHANQISGFDTKQIGKSNYLDEVRKLAHWVLKFQIKKAALNTIPRAEATLYNVNALSGQNRIEKFLKNKQFKDKVESFKKNKLRGYWNGILTVNPTGHDYYTDTRAVNFVLGIKEENSNQSFDFLSQH